MTNQNNKGIVIDISLKRQLERARRTLVLVREMSSKETVKRWEEEIRQIEILITLGSQ